MTGMTYSENLEGHSATFQTKVLMLAFDHFLANTTV